MAISVPLELPEETLKQLQQLMLVSAQDAFKQASQQQSFRPWMTLSETAKYMHISPHTLNKFIKQGLRPSLVNGVQRISQKEADRFYNEHQI